MDNEKMMHAALTFIEEWVEPQNDQEHEFVNRFAKDDYEPSLIFNNGDIASRAMVSPEAAWKLRNLERMEK